MPVENATVRYDTTNAHREDVRDKVTRIWQTRIFPWRLQYMNDFAAPESANPADLPDDSHVLIERRFETIDALVVAIRRINGRHRPPHVFLAGAGSRMQDCAAACKDRKIKSTFKEP